jgi:hypothetical protein
MANKLLKISVCFFALFFTYGITQNNKIATNDKLLNGDFEQELNAGWQTSNDDYAGSSEITRIQVGKNHIAYLIKDLCGYAELSQIVKLDNLNQNFSVRLKLNATSNREGYHSTAALILSFLDKNNKVLAESQIAYSTDQLTNNPVPYSYPTKPEEWETHNINLKDELNKHFSEIAINKIKKLKITLSAYNDQTNGC